MASAKGNIDFDKWTDESVKNLSYTAKIIHMTLMAYVRNLGSSYVGTSEFFPLSHSASLSFLKDLESNNATESATYGPFNELYQLCPPLPNPKASRVVNIYKDLSYNKETGECSFTINEAFVSFFCPKIADQRQLFVKYDGPTEELLDILNKGIFVIDAEEEGDGLSICFTPKSRYKASKYPNTPSLILNDFGNGVSVEEIAAKYKYSRAWVYAIVRKATNIKKAMKKEINADGAATPAYFSKITYVYSADYVGVYVSQSQIPSLKHNELCATIPVSSFFNNRAPLVQRVIQYFLEEIFRISASLKQTGKWRTFYKSDASCVVYSIPMQPLFDDIALYFSDKEVMIAAFEEVLKELRSVNVSCSFYEKSSVMDGVFSLFQSLELDKEHGMAALSVARFLLPHLMCQEVSHEPS